LTFSPDGNRIYFARIPTDEAGPNVLYQVPVLGGPARKLLTDIDTTVTFSPDGKRLAFARGNPTKGERLLLLANADGTEEQVLARHKLEDRSLVGPAWSPNGETIVFALGGSGPDALYLNLLEVRLKDRVEKQISFHQWSSIAAFCWLRDGNGLVVSAAEEPGSNSQIWYVSYPTGSVRSITSDLNDYLSLSLAADSSSLVAVRSEQVSDIWLVPVSDTSQASRITNDRLEGVGGISWTPDGRLVHASRASDNQEIWIMNKDGSEKQQLTFAGGWDSRPTVSPDGRYIVFVSRRSGSGNIWRMDIDGRNQKQLTRGNMDWNPQITPDNQWVIYTAGESGQRTLWKVPIDGGNPVQITNFYSPLIAVSPEDGQIAYAYDEPQSSKRRVAIIPLEGGTPTRVFDFPHPFRQGIRWAPDGRTLTYLGVPARSNIWSQPLDGTPPKKIADFAPDRIFSFDWSRDGKNLAVARGTITSDVVLIKDLPEQH
jgi:TolB protein